MNSPKPVKPTINSTDRLCLAFSVAFSRIVNSDFLCYQVYESDEGPGRLPFCRSISLQDPVDAQAEKPAASSTSSP